MKTFRYSNVSAVFATVLSAAAVLAQDQGSAQGSRASGDSPNDPSYLLTLEAVQKELALSDNQKARLQKFENDQTAKGKAFFGGLMGLSQDEIQKQLDARAKKTRSEISRILTPQQMGRLNEVCIQVAGVVALNFDDVAGKLKLTAEQKGKLKDLGDDSRRRLAELNSNGRPTDEKSRQDRRKKLEEIKSNRTDEAIAILTNEQKAKFEALQGKKFDTTNIQFSRRSFSDRGQINAPIAVPPPGQ